MKKRSRSVTSITGGVGAAVLSVATLLIGSTIGTSIEARADVPASQIQIVGSPVALIEPDPPGPPTFSVYVRLNHSLQEPPDGEGSLAAMALDGAGGGGMGSLVDARLRAHPCYYEAVSNDVAYSRTLRDPHPGTGALLTLDVTGPAPNYVTLKELRTRVRLKRDRHPNDFLYYPRHMGCFKRGV